MLEELWKDIVGYEGLYQVSNLGRVRSVDRLVNHRNGFLQKEKGVVKKAQDNGRGYLSVSLFNGGEKRFYIHRLVAEMFIQNNKKYKEVNHIDGNKKNNKAENLEWCTSKENKQHAHRLGLYKHKPLTEERKKVISKKLKELWKQGAFDNKKKIEYTQEYRKRQSEAHKGKIAHTTKVVCVETGEIFNSEKEASIAKCGTKSSVKCYFCGKQKLAGGYHWEKLNEKSLFINNI